MRKVITGSDDVFGLSDHGYIPETDEDRNELQELGITPFTGEMWHIEGDEIVYEKIT